MTCNRYLKLRVKALKRKRNFQAEYINGNDSSQGEYVLEQNTPPLIPQEAIITTPDIPPVAGEIPAHTNWKGDYIFDVTFDHQIEKLTKGTSWTYSEELDKLFVAPLKSCPFNFSTECDPPEGSIIRALPIYSRPENMSEIVQRCPNHSLASDNSNKDFSAPIHLVRCDLTSADYVTCHHSGRLSVVVPYELPQAGTEHTTYLYKFMCYSSCVGGLNRRPIMLIFTLEHDGVVLGRRSIKIRICACPGRDKKAEEKQKHSRSLSRQASLTTKPSTTAQSNINNKRKNATNEEIYYVPVHGRDNYETILKITEALELRSMNSSEQLEAYRTERTRLIEKINRFQSTENISSCTRKMNSQETNVLSGPKIVYTNQITNKKICIEKDNQLSKINYSENFLNQPCSSNSLSITVSSWLQELGLSAYTDMFHNEGYVIMDDLYNITFRDFDRMKIGKAHRTLLLEKLSEYRMKTEPDNPSSQVSNSSQSSTESGFTSLKTKQKYYKRSAHDHLPLKSKSSLKSSLVGIKR